MGQIVDKAVFESRGMRVRVVHEGDLFKVVKLDYHPSGSDIFCDVVLERVKNNAVINRPK